MSAQPEHHHDDPRVQPIPHTINAIGDALTGAKRARFYGEVLAAEEGEAINTVLRRWWTEAMLGRVPGAESSRANAAAGEHLVHIDDLLAQVEGSAR